MKVWFCSMESVNCSVRLCIMEMLINTELEGRIGRKKEVVVAYFWRTEGKHCKHTRIVISWLGCELVALGTTTVQHYSKGNNKFNYKRFKV